MDLRVCSICSTAIVIQNFISLIFADDTKTIRGGAVAEGLPIFGARITPIQITIIVVSALLLALCSLFMKKSKIGKAMRAVANDPELARVVGIESDQVILFTRLRRKPRAAYSAIVAYGYEGWISPWMNARSGYPPKPWRRRVCFGGLRRNMGEEATAVKPWSFTFVLGSVLAATAAILISLDADMTPMMGFYGPLMGVVALQKT